MNGLQRAALACLVLGVAALAYAAATGDVRVGVFLIVPFVQGSGPWAFVGMLLLMAAMVLGFLGAARRMAGSFEPIAPGDGREARTQRRSGGVVLLGPIPIVWGSDRKILPWMIAAGAALLILAFALTRT